MCAVSGVRTASGSGEKRTRCTSEVETYAIAVTLDHVSVWGHVTEP